MNPTSKPLAVELGGKRYLLHFDINTFGAFEDKSGKFFLDFLMNVQEAVKMASEQNDPSFLLRKLSVKDIHAFIWAACHVYQNDEPIWPLTMGKLGRLLDVDTLTELLPNLLKGVSDNAPEVKHRPTRPLAEEEVNDLPLASGGEAYGPSDEEVLASLTLKSDD